MIKHEWFYPVKIKNCHLGAFRLAGKITSHLTTWWRFAPAWRVCCLNDKTKRQHLVVVRHIIHIGKLNYLEKKDSPNTSIFDHFRHIFLLLFLLVVELFWTSVSNPYRNPRLPDSGGGHFGSSFSSHGSQWCPPGNSNQMWDFPSKSRAIGLLEGTIVSMRRKIRESTHFMIHVLSLSQLKDLFFFSCQKISLHLRSSLVNQHPLVKTGELSWTPEIPIIPIPVQVSDPLWTASSRTRLPKSSRRRQNFWILLGQSYLKKLIKLQLCNWTWPAK